MSKTKKKPAKSTSRVAKRRERFKSVEIPNDYADNLLLLADRIGVSETEIGTRLRAAVVWLVDRELYVSETADEGVSETVGEGVSETAEIGVSETADATAAKQEDKPYWAAVADELIGSGITSQEVNDSIRARLKAAFGADYTTAPGTPSGRLYRHLERYVAKAYKRVSETADGGVSETADGGVSETADGGVSETADDGVSETADESVTGTANSYPGLPRNEEKAFLTAVWQDAKQVKHVAFEILGRRLREIYGPDRYCTFTTTTRPEQRECAGVYNRLKTNLHRLAQTV